MKKVFRGYYLNFQVPCEFTLDSCEISSWEPCSTSNYTHCMVVTLRNGQTYYPFATLDEFQRFVKGGRSNMLESLKKYLGDNRDFIFTLALLFLADQFLLGGALRGRLEGILSKAADRLEAKNATTAS